MVNAQNFAILVSPYAEPWFEYTLTCVNVCSWWEYNSFMHYVFDTKYVKSIKICPETLHKQTVTFHTLSNISINCCSF